MPLKWKHGTNPYVVNYFGKVQIGPNARAPAIHARAKNLIQLLKAGNTVELGGQPLDEYAVNEAAKKLTEPADCAQELLLVHPQSQTEQGNLKSLSEKVKQTAASPEQHWSIRLVQPAAIFWFLPDPVIEIGELPEFETLGLVKAGDESDLELDIVFDE